MFDKFQQVAVSLFGAIIVAAACTRAPSPVLPSNAPTVSNCPREEFLESMHSVLVLLYRGDRRGASAAFARAEAAYPNDGTPASKWAKQFLDETRPALNPELEQTASRELSEPPRRRLHASPCMTEEIHARSHAALTPRQADGGR